jgi:MFS family permease
MGLYGLSAASAPALAPVIAGFAVQYKGWRWAFWEMLWLSSFTLALLAFTLPEVREFDSTALMTDLVKHNPIAPSSTSSTPDRE